MEEIREDAPSPALAPFCGTEGSDSKVTECRGEQPGHLSHLDQESGAAQPAPAATDTGQKSLSRHVLGLQRLMTDVVRWGVTATYLSKRMTSVGNVSDKEPTHLFSRVLSCSLKQSASAGWHPGPLGHS